MFERKYFRLFAVLPATALCAVIGIGGFSNAGVVAARQIDAPRVSQSSGLSLDEQLLEMSKRDPAFGGMFVDADGRLTMYVRDDALAAQDGRSRLATMSVDALTSFRGNEQIAEAAATRRINVLPAKFSFTQLYDWHEQAKAVVLGVPGVVLTDISEDRNRLRVGVETAELAGSVRRRLANAAIPSDAVIVELTPPMRQLASLRSKFRPLKGGIQINFSNYLCTLGFLAIRAGVTGVVTNSHCTSIQGGVQSTIFHQPVASGSTNRIGLEVRDPAYFTGGVCPSGRKCRYSDTSFARVPYTSGPSVTTTRGAIARPVALNAITVGTSHFRITSETYVPLLNETLNKVGRTTGWSRGQVVATCVTVNVAGTKLTQLCQDIVKANVAAGDSGSPVFRMTNRPRSGDVRLYGILWGGGTLDGVGTVFVFSAMGSRNIQRSSEMGTLTTCASGFSC